MPWTATFSKDTDNDSIGTVQATFTAQDGRTFTYSRRVDTSKSTDRQAFISEAKAALQAASDKQTNEASKASTVETSLNS